MTFRGFTLIEVLVAIVITSTLLVIMLGFLTQRVAQNAQQSARSDMLRELQLTTNLMMDDIRHSSNANQENRWPDSHHPDGEYAWSSDEETLVLSRPATDQDDSFLYKDPFTYIPYKDDLIFFIEDGILYKRTLAADTEDAGDNSAQSTCPANTSGCLPDSKLAEHVSDILFRYINADDETVAPNEARAVEVFIEVRDTVYRREIEVDYDTRGVFRN